MAPPTVFIKFIFSYFQKDNSVFYASCKSGYIGATPSPTVTCHHGSYTNVSGPLGFIGNAGHHYDMGSYG